MAMSAKEKREARDQKLRDEGAAAARAEAAPRTEAQKVDVQQINQRQFQDPLSGAMAQGNVAPPSKGRTVVVACKLGIASYQLQLSKLVPQFEQNMQGGREIKAPEKYGPIVILRGTSYPRGTVPDGFPPPPLIVGGAALNYGIDAEWFEEWLRQHAKDPIVMNKMIFAHESQDAVIGAAKEMAAFQSGLEPINPKSDKRVTKSTRPEVQDVEEEESRAKKRRQVAAAG